MQERASTSVWYTDLVLDRGPDHVMSVMAHGLACAFLSPAGLQFAGPLVHSAAPQKLRVALLTRAMDLGQRVLHPQAWGWALLHHMCS